MPPSSNVHLPERHALARGHTVPHAPQLLRSLWRSVHWPEQRSVDGGQPHCIAVHTFPPVHATPHAPQLVALFVRFTHAPLQSVVPPVQVVEHVPLLHTPPSAGHAVPPPSAAQPPQLAGSELGLTHTPLHTIAPPVPHTHVPPEQVNPDAQA